MLIDATFAEMAETLGLPVSDYDTAPAGSGVTVREPARGGETVVDVLLATTSRLAGTVTAASSGSPVAGAGVTLTDPLGMVTGARRTGPDGGYSFSGLKSGEYVLAVSAGRFRPEARPITVSDSGEARADIGLAADMRLSGVVVTSNGTRPVPGARVILLDDTGAVAAAADTDQAGRYTIEGLSSGAYTAIVSGYPPTASALHIPGPAGTVWHDIRLRHTQAACRCTDQQVAGQD
jgi:Carboxypeptidase regulatory-like domain